MNINDNFRQAFDALLEKYAELLIGDNSPEAAEKVRYWALFNHIHKTMPALTSHWNSVHPEQKTAVRELFEEIRDKGRLHREAGAQPTSNSESGKQSD
ncbi:DUF2573 family protein [Paenibacillus alkalitolerans]|uniref:DUF2573 family protein n=1 Tax=Paenibacillus alkalitolerans TaxID=2799335 RepID=UPI0018F6DAE3|nr:DUF2573 family protein [Paenibacillus alkalitolerans]